MNLGIVTVWDERGAGYVSKLYFEYLKKFFDIKIYARGYSKNNFKKEKFVYTAKKVESIKPMSINKKEFKKWIDFNKIEILLFNEQQSWEPILWCKNWKIKTAAYIDYYTEETIDLHFAYDLLICNTQRHYEAFSKHHNCVFYKWGTNLETFNPNHKFIEIPTFFHSCGYSPNRKGTDKVLEIFNKIDEKFKLIIHSQVDLESKFSKLKNVIKSLKEDNRLEIINKTVEAPGLYHLGDYYVYPTKLEGIGLTLIEAMACGLIPIIPNAQPMNEFVDEKYSYKIEINRLYSRSDGYYWPQVDIEPDSFLKIILEIITNHQKKPSKEKIATFARKNLNIMENFKGLEKDIIGLKFKELDTKNKKKIIAYEFNRPIKHSKVSFIINKLYSLLFKLKRF